MRKSKHNKEKSRRSKKALVLLWAVIIIGSCSIGGSLAYLQVKTGVLTNIFNPSKVSCAVHESGGGYSVRNTGDIPVYIRASVVCTWTDVGNNVHWQKPGYTVSGDGWDIETSDGFLYYKNPVDAGNATSEIVVNATDTAPDSGWTFTVQLLSEAIQSTPSGVVADKWGVAVDGNGSISK